MLTWSIANVAGRRTPPLGNLILATQRPHFLIVSEAYRCTRHLRWLCERYGYTLIQYNENREAKSVAILVRNDVRIARFFALRMDQPWYWGRNGNKRRAPRTYPVVIVEHEGQWVHVIGVHLPPKGKRSGGKNGPARDESRNALVEYANVVRALPWIAAGDHNMTGRELVEAYPGRRWYVMWGGKVDHSLTRNIAPAGKGHHRAPRGMHGWVTFKGEL